MGALAARVRRSTATNIGYLHERVHRRASEFVVDVSNNVVGAYLGQLTVNLKVTDT